MSALKDLKKRLNGVLATKQLTSAMKTVSSIKFSRVNGLLSSYKEYMDECDDIVKKSGISTKKTDNSNACCLYVLISGNRGLCGGYNIELFNFFDEIYNKNKDTALFIACGKTAVEHCKTKGIPLENTVKISDVPAFSEAVALCDILLKLYEENRVNEINFVCQNHINLLKQTPVVKKFLPVEENKSLNSDIIFIPDKNTVAEQMYSFYLNNTVYKVLLNCAAGVQAATLGAMRSAYDTANESAAVLQTSINRRRQAYVTASVIETASENTNYESEV